MFNEVSRCFRRIIQSPSEVSKGLASPLSRARTPWTDPAEPAASTLTNIKAPYLFASTMRLLYIISEPHMQRGGENTNAETLSANLHMIEVGLETASESPET